jgi:hypothetical protein
VRRIYPHGLANANNPLIKAALQAKYPDKGRDLPLHVYEGQCVDKMERLKADTLGLDIGVASGFGGLRNEHLQCLGEVWNYNKFRVLEAFCIRYVNGNLTPLVLQGLGLCFNLLTVQKQPKRLTYSPSIFVCCLKIRYIYFLI